MLERCPEDMVSDIGRRIGLGYPRLDGRGGRTTSLLQGDNGLLDEVKSWFFLCLGWHGCCVVVVESEGG